MFNFTNFRDHPHKRNSELFFFYQVERADYLQNLLDKEQIKYERGEEIDEEKNMPVYFFITHKYDHDRMMYLNNYTIGKFRQPFISDAFSRWLLIIVSMFVLGLALVGFLVS